MKNRAVGWVIVVALGLGLGVASSGCSRNTAPPDQVGLSMKLPGASNVFAALTRKDYEGAMTSWVKVKQSTTSQDQQIELAALTRELRNQLLQASATDPKAAEALDALRAITSGR